MFDAGLPGGVKESGCSVDVAFVISSRGHPAGGCSKVHECIGLFEVPDVRINVGEISTGSFGRARACRETGDPMTAGLKHTCQLTTNKPAVSGHEEMTLIWRSRIAWRHAAPVGGGRDALRFVSSKSVPTT